MNSAHMAIVDDASAAMVSGIVTQEKLIGSHIDFGPLFLKVRELALFAPWRLRCQVSDQAITRPSKSPLPDPLSCTDGKLAAVLLDRRKPDALYKKTHVQAILKSVCPEHAANQCGTHCSSGTGLHIIKGPAMGKEGLQQHGTIPRPICWSRGRNQCCTRFARRYASLRLSRGCSSLVLSSIAS